MSMVPYSGALARYSMRYGPSVARRAARYAFSPASRFAYSNRAAIVEGAKTIIRGANYVSRARQAKRQKKEPRVFSSVPKASTFQNFVPGTNTFININQKSLYSDRLSFPATGTTVGSRIGSQIYLKGINLCASFYSAKALAKPVEFHIAVCQLGNDTSVSAEWRLQFFRAQGPSGNTLDFEEWTNNPAWDIRYLCNPLNPDNKKVLLHRKFLIDNYSNPAGGAVSYPQGMSRLYHRVEKYIPINTTMQFGDNATQIPEKPIVVFVWALTQRPDDHNAVSAVTVGHFNYNTRLVYKNTLG